MLDLRQDRYYCLGPDDSTLALTLLTADGHTAEDHTAGDAEDLERVARQLLAQGLLTADRKAGKELALIPRSRLSADLLGYPIDQRPEIRRHHVLRVLWSAVATALRLRCLPLHLVIGRVRRRKQRAADRGQPHRGDLQQLVEIYKRLRPLLFSAKNQCLYDSLVLSELLAGYGCFPACVIGVKMAPFQAHCWVEQDGVVFNDSVARVVAFTPIMAV